MVEMIKLDHDPIEQYLDILKDVDKGVALKRFHAKLWSKAMNYAQRTLHLSKERAQEEARKFAKTHVDRFKLRVGLPVE